MAEKNTDDKAKDTGQESLRNRVAYGCADYLKQEGFNFILAVIDKEGGATLVVVATLDEIMSHTVHLKDKSSDAFLLKMKGVSKSETIR